MKNNPHRPVTSVTSLAKRMGKAPADTNADLRRRLKAQKDDFLVRLKRMNDIHTDSTRISSEKYKRLLNTTKAMELALGSCTRLLAELISDEVEAKLNSDLRRAVRKTELDVAAARTAYKGLPGTGTRKRYG